MSILYCYCFLQLFFTTIYGLDTTTIKTDKDYSIEIIEEYTTTVNDFLIDEDDGKIFVKVASRGLYMIDM